MQQIIPDVKKVGLLYCSAEANSVLQIDMAKEALDTAGIEYEDYTVSNSNEIPTVVESMVGNVDCVYTNRQHDRGWYGNRNDGNK